MKPRAMEKVAEKNVSVSLGPNLMISFKLQRRHMRKIMTGTRLLINAARVVDTLSFISHTPSVYITIAPI